MLSCSPKVPDSASYLPSIGDRALEGFVGAAERSNVQINRTSRYSQTSLRDLIQQVGSKQPFISDYARGGSTPNCLLRLSCETLDITEILVAEKVKDVLIRCLLYTSDAADE